MALGGGGEAGEREAEWPRRLPVCAVALGQLVGMRAVMGLVAREAETAAELCCSPPVWTDGLFPALVTAMLTSPHTSQSLLKVSAPEMNAP